MVEGGQTALGVQEMILEETGKAMLANDFDAFAHCFALPHTIETPDRKTVLKTRAALQDVFDLVLEDYRKRGVTNLIRICEIAEYRGPLRIEATYMTHVMSGNLRVLDPYPSFCVLELIEDRWQISASQYALDKATTVGRALETRMGAASPTSGIRHTKAATTDERKN
ncbi:hypothetical protein Z946_812 [Sulfitobacter noctilucicola]|uniref:SnoaL-like domain-containing protein n=1 Tax=Sulfitobacter noctilucicola TaxID=1342301 RepID=A0A7W6M7K0_9RHOB|nr:hypothetical protein [Sulfitobacter noctilucicola]KIN61956.1 hypothetical protein Z946_812 [Sulfitobacter noctilucicola]MBB4173523.1 hypothetical protein [Sulfitobacter noctilucicola]